MRMQFLLGLMHLQSHKTAEPSQASPESATPADRITYLLKVISNASVVEVTSKRKMYSICARNQVLVGFAYLPTSDSALGSVSSEARRSTSKRCNMIYMTLFTISGLYDFLRLLDSGSSEPKIRLTSFYLAFTASSRPNAALVYMHMSRRILSISINTHNDGGHGDARCRFFGGRYS